MKYHDLTPILSEQIRSELLNLLEEGDEFLGQRINLDDVNVSVEKYGWDSQLKISLDYETEWPYDLLLDLDPWSHQVVTSGGNLVTEMDFRNDLPSCRLRLTVSLKAALPKEDLDLLASLGKVSYSINCNF